MNLALNRLGGSSKKLIPHAQQTQSILDSNNQNTRTSSPLHSQRRNSRESYSSQSSGYREQGIINELRPIVMESASTRLSIGIGSPGKDKSHRDARTNVSRNDANNSNTNNRVSIGSAHSPRSFASDNSADAMDQDMNNDGPGMASNKLFSARAGSMYGNMNIDFDLINESLAHVNAFARRKQAEKLPPVLMYEITCDGQSLYKEFTLRELLQYVNDEANQLDKAAERKELAAAREKFQQQQQQHQQQKREEELRLQREKDARDQQQQSQGEGQGQEQGQTDSNIITVAPTSHSSAAVILSPDSTSAAATTGGIGTTSSTTGGGIGTTSSTTGGGIDTTSSTTGGGIGTTSSTTGGGIGTLRQSRSVDNLHSSSSVLPSEQPYIGRLDAAGSASPASIAAGVGTGVALGRGIAGVGTGRRSVAHNRNGGRRSFTQQDGLVNSSTSSIANAAGGGGGGWRGWGSSIAPELATNSYYGAQRGRGSAIGNIPGFPRVPSRSEFSEHSADFMATTEVMGYYQHQHQQLPGYPTLLQPQLVHHHGVVDDGSSSNSSGMGSHLGSSGDALYNAVGELRLRDLRRLDFQFNPNEERSVLIRRHVVLIAMDPIRALVMAKRIILMVPPGADSLISILDRYMKEWSSPEDVKRGFLGSTNDKNRAAGAPAGTDDTNGGEKEGDSGPSTGSGRVNPTMMSHTYSENSLAALDLAPSAAGVSLLSHTAAAFSQGEGEDEGTGAGAGKDSAGAGSGVIKDRGRSPSELAALPAPVLHRQLLSGAVSLEQAKRLLRAPSIAAAPHNSSTSSPHFSPSAGIAVHPATASASGSGVPEVIDVARHESDGRLYLMSSSSAAGDLIGLSDSIGAAWTVVATGAGAAAAGGKTMKNHHTKKKTRSFFDRPPRILRHASHSDGEEDHGYGDAEAEADDSESGERSGSDAERAYRSSLESHHRRNYFGHHSCNNNHHDGEPRTSTMDNTKEGRSKYGKDRTSHKKVGRDKGRKWHSKGHSDHAGSDRDHGRTPRRLSIEDEIIQTLRRKAADAFMKHEFVPFESHAYEALLTTVKSLEEQEYNRLNETIQKVLVYSRTGSLLPIEIQEEMRNLKNDLSMMMRRISGARAALNELTEDDEEMALMNLSSLKDKPRLYAYPLVPEILIKHDEIEELLESYLIDMNSMEAQVDYLRSQIQTAEELVSLRLDTSRNELLFANTALAILACCFGLGAFLTGIFGMNLDNTNTIQNIPLLFMGVIVASIVMMLLMFAGIVIYMQQSGMMPTRLKIKK